MLLLKRIVITAMRDQKKRDSKTTNSRLTEEQKLLLQKSPLRQGQMLENSFSQLDYIFLLQYYERSRKKKGTQYSNSTQCAAVTTQLLFIRDPPQM